MERKRLEGCSWDCFGGSSSSSSEAPGCRLFGVFGGGGEHDCTSSEGLNFLWYWTTGGENTAGPPHSDSLRLSKLFGCECDKSFTSKRRM
jgi:hypothetical protein